MTADPQRPAPDRQSVGEAPHEPAREALTRLVGATSPEAWMRRAQAEPGTKIRDAAVLMLFGRGEGPHTRAGEREVSRLDGLGVADLDVLLLQRADHLRHHAGQPAFPGGGWEPGDESSAHTALREAEEETGLDPRGVEVLGELEPLYVPVSAYEVTPVLGWWAEPSEIRVADVGESSLVRRVAVADLVAPDNRGMFAPKGYRWKSCVFDVEVMRVWGFTAGLLDFALDTVGWAGEWDRSRRLHIDF